MMDWFKRTAHASEAGLPMVTDSTATPEKILKFNLEQFMRSGVEGRRSRQWALRHGLDFLLIADYHFRHEGKAYLYIVVKMVARDAFFPQRERILEGVEVFHPEQLELAMKAFLKRKYQPDPFIPSGFGKSRQKLREVLGLNLT